jgi:hypothetical protein
MDRELAICAQLNAACVSTVANIAEGFIRGGRKEFAHSVRIAAGSNAPRARPRPSGGGRIQATGRGNGKHQPDAARPGAPLEGKSRRIMYAPSTKHNPSTKHQARTKHRAPRHQALT